MDDDVKLALDEVMDELRLIKKELSYIRMHMVDRDMQSEEQISRSVRMK